MKIQTQYLTTNNSYDTNDPGAIVVHNTDNFRRTADAKNHAQGLRDGYMNQMSWHLVVDDKAAYQCLPYNRGAWHVGVNYGGKLFGKINNRNSICVEMCVNSGYDYEKAFQNTVDVVKQLMAQFNIPAEKVYQHYDICAKDCPSQIRARGDWSRFKQLIGASGTDYQPGGEIVVDKLYRVRKTWTDSASQTGAFYDLNNAKANADNHPGYSVFDWDGVSVYTSKKEEIYTQQEWVNMIAPIAVDLARVNSILPSVIIAQTALETGWGMTDLTRKYNIVGMKADLINSTWKDHSVWDGTVYRKVTLEYYNGRAAYVEDDFRVYRTFRQCIEDYEAFLLHVRNNKGYKYRRIQGKTDPAEVIHMIRIGTGTESSPEGYCTDPAYETKILKIISEYDLTQYDSVMIPEQYDKYAVRRSFDEMQFQLGLYSVLDNAINQADANWGYKVYDVETGRCVYEPKQNMIQKLIAKCLQFNDYVLADNKAGNQWKYYNNKRSKKTFWLTREAKLFITNCMGAVSFALKDIGIPVEALQWYGTKGGIHWLNDHAKGDAEKYFDLIDAKGKTVKKCIQDGTILPGDAVTYVDMAHTNIYLGNGTSYDAGHAFCTGSGEGAKYQKWVGETPHQGSKVAVVVRLKNVASVNIKYRVQAGAYNSKKLAETRKAVVKEQTKGIIHDGEVIEDGYDCFIEKTDMYRVYCGSFDFAINAEQRKQELASVSIKDAFVAEYNAG